MKSCSRGIKGYVAVMDWQQLVSLGFVGAAGSLLVGRKLRRPKFSFQRDLPCGCAASNNGNSLRSSIVYRARKGERAEVRVKMK
jgi:hypothetical protein